MCLWYWVSLAAHAPILVCAAPSGRMKKDHLHQNEWVRRRRALKKMAGNFLLLWGLVRWALDGIAMKAIEDWISRGYF